MRSWTGQPGLDHLAWTATSGEAAFQDRLPTGTDAAAGSTASAQRSLGVYVLAVLPLADMVLAQVQARLDPSVGPLSLAQVYHGVILLGMGVFLLARLGSFPTRHRFVLAAGACFGVGVLLSAVCQWGRAETSLEDLVAGLQVLYWLVVWVAGLVICRQSRHWRTVLYGLVVAGAYSALSVAVFFVLLGPEASPYEDVTASAGGLNTAKGLGGVLGAAGLLSAWLFRERFRRLGMVLLLACFGGVVLTYQRAGLLATCVGALWLAGWYSRGRSDRRARAWALRPVAVFLLATAGMVALGGLEDLRTRWEDIGDPQKAGSGRLAFWQVAGANYAELDPVSQLTGVGYSAMTDAMESEYGARIHSHNDFLDVLLLFGAVGMVGFLAVYGAVWKLAWSCGSGSARFAAGRAILLVLLSASVLTGQILGPHVMTFYLLAVTGVCLSREDQPNEPAPPADLPAQPGGRE